MYKRAKPGIEISTYECRDNTLSSCFSLWHLKRPTGAVESDCVVIFHLGILLQSCNCLISLLIRRLAFTDRVACSVVMRVIQIKWEVMGAWFHNFAVHKGGHKSLKDLRNGCVLNICRRREVLSLGVGFWRGRQEAAAGEGTHCHTAAGHRSSWSGMSPMMLGGGGSEEADGARDITNPIMNSLLFGFDTLFLFISWYSLAGITHALCLDYGQTGKKAQRCNMNISWICSLVSCCKLISSGAFKDSDVWVRAGI